MELGLVQCIMYWKFTHIYCNCQKNVNSTKVAYGANFEFWWIYLLDDAFCYFEQLDQASLSLASREDYLENTTEAKSVSIINWKSDWQFFLSVFFMVAFVLLNLKLRKRCSSFGFRFQDIFYQKIPPLPQTVL